MFSRVFLTLAFLCSVLMGSDVKSEPKPSTQPILSSYFVNPASDELMQKISDQFEVTRRLPEGFEIVVPAHRSAELYALLPSAKLIEADISVEIRAMEKSWAGSYHDLATTEAHIRQIAQKYPDIAAIKTYGKTQDGRPLYVLKISDNVHLNEKEPEIMITSATHGNELISVEVVLGIMDSLVAGYRTNARARDAIDNHELFFIPVVNADGYNERSRYANGVDPNREYPWPGDPNKVPNECIASLIRFFHSRDIKGSLDFHSYGELFMYPWAYTREAPDSLDERMFQQVSSGMAKANGYRYGQISRILYPAKGSSADYYYWKNRTIGFGIEIGHAHVPSPSTIPKYVQDHLQSTLIFIESFK